MNPASTLPQKAIEIKIEVLFQRISLNILHDNAAALKANANACRDMYYLLMDEGNPLALVFLNLLGIANKHLWGIILWEA